MPSKRKSKGAKKMSTLSPATNTPTSVSQTASPPMFSQSPEMENDIANIILNFKQRLQRLESADAQDLYTPLDDFHTSHDRFDFQGNVAPINQNRSYTSSFHNDTKDQPAPHYQTPWNRFCLQANNQSQHACIHPNESSIRNFPRTNQRNPFHTLSDRYKRIKLRSQHLRSLGVFSFSDLRPAPRATCSSSLSLLRSTISDLVTALKSLKTVVESVTTAAIIPVSSNPATSVSISHPKKHHPKPSRLPRRIRSKISNHGKSSTITTSAVPEADVTGVPNHTPPQPLRSIKSSRKRLNTPKSHPLPKETSSPTSIPPIGVTDSSCSTTPVLLEARYVSIYDSEPSSHDPPISPERAAFLR